MLQQCPSCHRHIRSESCPFCGHHGERAPSSDTAARVGTAAAVVLALAMCACYGTPANKAARSPTPDPSDMTDDIAGSPSPASTSVH